MMINSRTILIAFISGSILVLLFSFFASDYLPGTGSDTDYSETKEAVTEYRQVSNNIQTGIPQSLLATFNLTTNAAHSTELPPLLREISGLAVTAEGEIFAHNDEDGIIFNIDIDKGSVISTFDITLNGKRIQDDLEGIAVAEANMYVVNSAGTLYEFLQKSNGEAGECKVYPTGLGDDWEIEGLVYNASIRSLVIASKKPLGTTGDGNIGLFFWSIDSRALQHEKTIFMPIRNFADRIGKKKFRPSGIEWDAASGNYLLVAAKQRAVAEITAQGEFVAIQRLQKERHPQAEGIAILPGRGLLISDEGGTGAGRLTLYPPF